MTCNFFSRDHGYNDQHFHTSRVYHRFILLLDYDWTDCYRNSDHVYDFVDHPNLNHYVFLYFNIHPAWNHFDDNAHIYGADLSSHYANDHRYQYFAAGHRYISDHPR